MIEFTHHGSFSSTKQFLKKATHFKDDVAVTLESLGSRGVQALENSTPKRTGKTASSWSYEIVRGEHTTSIVWTNSNVVNYVNIAVILQTGHATRTGRYVEGRDYINPALRPIFDKIANDAWKAVTK